MVTRGVVTILASFTGVDGLSGLRQEAQANGGRWLTMDPRIKIDEKTGIPAVDKQVMSIDS